MTLWFTPSGEWAVCDGPGPLNVAGYLVEVAGGAWAIKDDPNHTHFLDQRSAAAAVLGKPLPEDLRYYKLKRGGETGVVLTYPDVIDRTLADGAWTLLASARTLGKLENA
jgi:hypothetical protein